MSRNFRDQYEEKVSRHVLKQRADEDIYVQLARRTVEEYVRTGRRLELPEGLPQEMYDIRAGRT